MAVNNDRPVGTGPATPARVDITPAPAQAPAAAPAAASKGWKEKAGKLGEQANTELQKELMRTARRDTKLIGTSVNIGLVTIEAGAKLKALDQRNDSDPVRNASGKVWHQLTFTGQARASSGIVSGSGNIESKVILPSDVASNDATLGKIFQSFRHNASELANGIATPFDSDKPFNESEVRALPAGAMYSTKFSKQLHLGASRGASAAAGDLGASASASIGDSISREFARSVYRMPAPGNRVYAEVGETSANSFGVSASFKAGAELDGAVGNAVERQLDKRYGTDGSFSAAMSNRKPLTIGGVFDLDKPEQKAAYEQLMHADPFELKAKRNVIMKDFAKAGVGFDVEAKESAATLNANLRVGRTNLLSYSSASRVSETQVRVANEDGSGLQTTSMDEAQYTKAYSGKIPMALLGREGNIDVRGTRIVEKDPQGNVVGTTLGAGMLMNIDMKRVSQAAIDRTSNLFKDLGIDLGAIDTSKAAGKKGHLDVEFAMTEDFFKNLQALAPQKEAALRAKLEGNYEDVNGEPPPWKNDRVFEDGYPSLRLTSLSLEFADAKRLLASTDTEEQGKAVQQYRIATKGRDLYADIESFNTFETVTTELAKAGGDPKTWKPIVKAAGKASPADFLVLAATAHELGAPIVQFGIKGEGVEVAAKPALGARMQNTAERVGKLTSRWE